MKSIRKNKENETTTTKRSNLHRMIYVMKTKATIELYSLVEGELRK